MIDLSIEETASVPLGRGEVEHPPGADRTCCWLSDAHRSSGIVVTAE
jgi:hypothetical protein